MERHQGPVSYVTPPILCAVPIVTPAPGIVNGLFVLPADVQPQDKKAQTYRIKRRRSAQPPAEKEQGPRQEDSWQCSFQRPDTEEAPRRLSSSTKETLLAVSSTQAGRKPLRMALRTDLMLDQAAQ